jgi:hypothetical protein
MATENGTIPLIKKESRLNLFLFLWHILIYLNMKTFLKENWYKLMIGSSMLIISFGFIIYAISPSYANNNLSKQNITPNDEYCIYLVDNKNRVWYHYKGKETWSWNKTEKILE